MKKSIKQTIAMILLLMVMVFSVTGCSSKKTEIENLMTEFEYACNTLDIDAILDCVNPQIGDKIKLAVGIAGMISEQDPDEMIENLADAIINESDINGSEFFSTIKIEVDKIKVDGESATVDAIVEYEVAGSQYKKAANFECIYYLEEWYVNNFSFK